MGSSHSGDEFPASELMQRMLEERRKDAEGFEQRMVPEVQFGLQHDFPAGRYGPTDEGALALAVGHDERNRKVVIDFGSSVTWLAMDPDQALHLASMLTAHAEAARGSELAVAIREALKEGKR